LRLSFALPFAFALYTTETTTTKKKSQFPKQLDDILYHFNAPIDFAIAYGSGVLSQQGYENVVIYTFIEIIYLPINQK